MACNVRPPRLLAIAAFAFGATTLAQLFLTFTPVPFFAAATLFVAAAGLLLLRRDARRGRTDWWGVGLASVGLALSLPVWVILGVLAVESVPEPLVVQLDNEQDAPASADIRVLQAGAVVYEGRFELSAGQALRVETGIREAGAYALNVSLADGRSAQQDVRVGPYYFQVDVRIQESRIRIAQAVA